MTKEELIQFLKTNLSVEIRVDIGEVTVDLYLGDEIVSSSSTDSIV